jgi:hypothetical protein
VNRSILLLASVLVAGNAGAQALQTATETAHTATTATSTASTPTTTAPAPTTSPQATFRSNVDLVALNVVVTDSDQKYVSGLRPSDFAVFEDGIQQDVSFFGASGVSLDLAILLDTSASMTGKMQLVQQAAIGFLNTLRADDRAIIVDIKDATKIMYPLGGDLEAAKQAILSTSPRGGTALYNGAYLTLKEMVKERRGNSEVRRQALVVLSDGDDTASLVSYDDLMDLAKQSGIARPLVLLAVGVRDESPGAGNRGTLVLPDGARRALGRLCGDRRGACDAVRDWLLIEEPKDGRLVSARGRSNCR